MSERISPHFSPLGSGNAGTSQAPSACRRLSTVATLGAVFLAAAAGCSSSGSQFGTGGATGTSSGGSLGSTGGSGPTSSGGVTGSGGSTVIGTGGSGPVGGSEGEGNGTGGTSSSGSGGSNVTRGSGGATAASGGSGVGGTVAAGGRVGTSTGGATAAGGSAGPACPKPVGQICHEFFANDNSANRVLYVNEFDATKNWIATAGDTSENSPRTIEVVDNTMSSTGKAVLVSLNHGFAEFDTATGRNLVRVLNYTAGGVSGAARLPNGQTALGTITAIVLVGPTGARVSSFNLPNPADELRAINRNPVDGHYWFSKLDDIFEVTETGAQVWTANLGPGTKGYAVWWRAGGGAYATTGAVSTVQEFDVNKTPVKTTGGKATFPELDFFSGFVRLASGNYVVANWLGHLAANDLNRPHLVEFNAQNQMVWKWGTQAQARQITNVYVIR